MQIEFYKPAPFSLAPTWIVVIGSFVYEMSENADAANGVNQYFGYRSDFSGFPVHELADEVPAAIARAAIARTHGG